ncbi:MAG: quinone oxidoreductase [Pseudomonadota bacterium]|nr:quinone oxidoreductase [Pseudomonadota bacterium]
MAKPTKMKAIQVSEFGGPEVCKFLNLPIPDCSNDEVLVKISLAGINYLDIYTREGVRGGPLPFILGSEGAGEVVEVGNNVGDLKSGDIVVFRGSTTGTYAEYATVPAWLNYKIPKEIAPEEAVTMHLQGMTAHYLANDVFPLQTNHTCLIHAGAGGVGHQLIQLAKEKGSRVFTTTGTPEKAKIALDFGADEVILYQETEFSEKVLELTNGEGVDVVFDSVGKATIDGSINCTKFLGTVALFGDASGVVPPLETRKLAANCIKLTRVGLIPFVADQAAIKKRCDELFSLYKTKKLKPLVSPIRPLSETIQVLTEMENRQTTGKLLLQP